MMRIPLALGLMAGAGAFNEEPLSLLQTMAIKRHTQSTAACDLCFPDETRFPEGLNGKCEKKLKRADKKQKACDKFTATTRGVLTGHLRKYREVQA
jgi:hypothetical protein